MDWITWLFFESLIALGVFLFVACFILLVHWRRTNNARPLLIGLAAAVMLLLVQSIVVTRREHAVRVLDAIVADAKIPATTALERSLAATFAIEGMDRDDFLEMVRARLTAARVAQVHQTDLQVADSTDNSFNATVVYLADVAVHEFRGWFKSKWRIRFIRDGGEWKIAEVVPLEFDNQPVGSFAKLPN